MTNERNQKVVNYTKEDKYEPGTLPRIPDGTEPTLTVVYDENTYAEEGTEGRWMVQISREALEQILEQAGWTL